MYRISFGAFTLTPSTLANSSAKQYASPICCPVRQDSRRIFCPFHPLVCRMMAASRRGDMFSSTVPNPTAVGDPCSATSKYNFSAAPVSSSVFLPVPTGRSIPRARRIAQKAGCPCQRHPAFFMLYGFSGDGYCLSFSNRGYHGSSVFVGWPRLSRTTTSFSCSPRSRSVSTVMPLCTVLSRMMQARSWRMANA